MTYHPSGQVATLTAVNPTTGNQVTRYVYGGAKAWLHSQVHRNDLLAAEIYRRMGFDDLPCQTIEQYVDLTVRLGTEPDFRQDISHRILERNHLIFEDADTVREHERLFELMIEEAA